MLPRHACCYIFWVKGLGRRPLTPASMLTMSSSVLSPDVLYTECCETWLRRAPEWPSYRTFPFSSCSDVGASQTQSLAQAFPWIIGSSSMPAGALTCTPMSSRCDDLARSTILSTFLSRPPWYLFSTKGRMTNHLRRRHEAIWSVTAPRQAVSLVLQAGGACRRARRTKAARIWRIRQRARREWQA